MSHSALGAPHPACFLPRSEYCPQQTGTVVQTPRNKDQIKTFERNICRDKIKDTDKTD